jgi:hypothetical protein
VRRGEALWLCLGALVLHAALVTSAAAQPRLRIEATDRTWDLTKEYDKGLAVGETAEHEFILKNVGTEPLEITEAKPEEAFLTTVLPEGPIAPGEEGRLKVVMTTEGMEPSLIDTQIVVKSNDPASDERPEVLTVKALIIPKPEALFVIEPQERDIGLVRVGETKTLTYTYQNAGSEPLDIDPDFFFDKRFEVEGIARQLLEPGPAKSFTLKFTARPEDVGKRLDAMLIVKTSAKELPRVICRVTGYVAPAERKPEGVQIIPKYLEQPNEPESRSYVFTVVNNTARTVEVVAMRGEEKLGTLVVKPQLSLGMSAKVSSADDLKDISFQVNAYYVSPEPAEPEGGATEVTPAGEGAGSKATEGTTTETETTEGEGGAPDDSGTETETDEPAGEGA